MEWKVEHIVSENKFVVRLGDDVALVEYRISNNVFDVISTLVPSKYEGQGIAGALVKAAYTYAKESKYQLKGSCSYAAIWLKRHPEY